MKVYIAGPMTGIPRFNIPAFDDAAKRLRYMMPREIEVVSPAELDDPEIRAISLASPDGNVDTLASHGMTWGDFLSRDVKLIADGGFDVIVVLPGWEGSRGARLETFVGYLAGCRIATMESSYDGKATLWDLSRSTLIKGWEGIK